MKNYPEGFPLELFDSEGNGISAGDYVRLLSIPEWLWADLDEEPALVVKSCEGKVMVIQEIDDYGYAWVQTVAQDSECEYSSSSFCMEPERLLKQWDT